MSRSSNKGSALAAALVILILVCGMGLALASLSVALNRSSAAYNSAVVAGYAAEAGLERAIFEMKRSEYDDHGNVWLMSVANDVREPLEPVEGDVVALDGLVVGGSDVDVFVYSRDDDRLRYVIVSRARFDDREICMAQEVKARDTWGRFVIFVNNETSNIGNVQMRGHLHSNRGIVFTSRMAEFFGDVTAVRGFSGQPVTFHALANPRATYIELPSVSDVNEVSVTARNPYRFSGDAAIELVGKEVVVTNGGTTSTLPLPENGVLYVNGSVTLKGNLNGRLTIVTPDRITITDNVKYVDGDGNPKFLLTKDGGTANPSSTGMDPWTKTNGYVYGLNPAYRGDSALGLITGDMVFLSKSAPFNAEVHAAMFAPNSTLYMDQTAPARGNVAIAGSLIVEKQVVRASGGTVNGYRTRGWVLSGHYVYDEDLRSNPPPGWFDLDVVVRGARYKVSSVVVQ